MNVEKFDQLVSSLEVKATQNASAYQQKVIIIALLGFIVLGITLLLALIPAALLVGFVLLVVASGGKALIVLLKLGKLLVLILIPAWIMLKTSVQLLFTRFPVPVGHAITAKQAPQLFKAIEAIRAHMNGPRIHHVLITDEINAAIAQHPKFGLFGWEQNYLILGLPLMQAMHEKELLAVIAHEYGHLSGHHSRLGGFIYRLRATWARLQSISESWHDWGSRAIAKLFSWYAPYFNAYTFVYARQNEYVADKNSADIIGPKHTANALMRVTIAAQFEQQEFWPAINRMIAKRAEPLHNKCEFWGNSLRLELDEAKLSYYIEKAEKVQTDHHDTHPSLVDRLKAIGVDFKTVAQNMAPPTENAASSLLGDALHNFTEKINSDWKHNVSESWRNRHQYLQECKVNLAKLEEKANLTEQEAWEKLVFTEEIAPETKMLPLFQNFLEQYPEHLSARYRRGMLLLSEENVQGIDDLEFVMSRDKHAILDCCESAWHFYADKDNQKAQTYIDRWEERNAYLIKVENELTNINPKDELAPHDLNIEVQTIVENLVKCNCKYIKNVYLVKRVLKTDPSINAYLLGFEAKWLNFGDKSEKILNNLATLDYPIQLHIVNLKHASYTKMKKTIKKLKISPIFEV